MGGTMSGQLRPVRYGLVLGTLAILYGFGLGAFFGIGEDWILERNERVAEAHFDAYRARVKDALDPEAAAMAAMQKTLDSSWRYWLRAHFHAGGIGSVAIGLSLVLSFLSVRPRLKTLISTLLGIGAVGYPLFWMMAGIRAPGLGSTDAAKDSLVWLATPTAGAALCGAGLALALIAHDLLIRRAEE